MGCKSGSACAGVCPGMLYRPPATARAARYPRIMLDFGEQAMVGCIFKFVAATVSHRSFRRRCYLGIHAQLVLQICSTLTAASARFCIRGARV